MNEADTQLFPNRWGEDNKLDDHIFNIPHTAAYVPDGKATLVATVTEPPPDGSITIRVPDGNKPTAVRVDGQDTSFDAERRRGVAFARVALPAESKVTVEVDYAP